MIRKRYMQSLWDQAESKYKNEILDCLPYDPTNCLLDVGCDDGAWTCKVAARIGASPDNVYGIEVVESSRALAEERGYTVRNGDLEETWPFDDKEFDIVHANQVIEHVKRLDHFVKEIKRVLKPSGLAVVSTENLSSWHNVIAAALGYMPFSLTNVSDTGPIGNPFALHAGEPVKRGESWQHIHVLTLLGLENIFTAHGFKIKKRFGAGYHPLSGRLAVAAANCDPRHSHFIGIAADLSTTTHSQGE